MKRTILIVMALLSVFALGAFRMQAGGPTRQQWEYKTMAAPVADLELNMTGREGWELITVPATPTDNGPRTLYVFKRPKQ